MSDFKHGCIRSYCHFLELQMMQSSHKYYSFLQFLKGFSSLETCLPYKKGVGGSIPLFPNDISILIFLNKIYCIVIYYGYRGVSNRFCMFL